MNDFLYNSVPVEFDPFSGPEIIQVIATTESQKEIWLSCIIGGDDANRSYNESITVCLNGPLDQRALLTAYAQLVSRHQSLRSTFSPDGLSMIVYSELISAIRVEDLTKLGADQQSEFLQQYGDTDAGTVFDITQGPLIRPTLFKLTENTHHLRITAHHIICDGWSMGVILTELASLYNTYSRNEIPTVAPAPEYSAYSKNQSEYFGTSEHQQTEKFWLNQFRQLPPVLNLPTDFERPAMRNFKSRRDDYRIEKSLIASVKKMGAKAGCSFVTTMLAAFEVLLHQATGQNDIVLGLPAAGQSATSSDLLIGHCVNLLPLRSFQDDNISFLEYLKNRKKGIFDAYDHQLFTFGTLLKKLSIPRDPSRVPLVPVIFNIDMAMNNGVSFAGLQHNLISNPRKFETFEIFLNATGSEDSLILEWSYNTSLFSADSISRLMKSYERLLTEVSNDPTRKIGDLVETIGNNKSYQYKGNNTEFGYPSSTLHALISEQAARTPDAQAIRFGSVSYSYSKLESLSNQMAAALTANGLKPGDIAGLATERSPLTLVAMLAILKTGAAYVPLDVEYPQDRITYMLEDSGASLLISSAKYQNRFSSSARELVIENLVEMSARYPVHLSQKGSTKNDLAYVLYTSGSTGKPKGVQIMHYNLVNFMCSMKEILSVKPTDRMLGLTTISFDISGMELYLPLITGAAIELVSSETGRDGFALLELIRTTRPSIVQATPATWQMLLEASWNNDTRINTICSGGEPLSRELAEKLIPRTNHLFNLYGPTETTIWSTAKEIAASDKIMTIGHPIGNTKVYILDSSGKPLGENEQGEIYISGDGVGKGYLNQPVLTAEKFVPDTFSGIEGSRMYRTGDLGKFLPNGDIQCLGRQDQQIKVRGYRIEPGEIEYCLSKQSSIRQATVIAREDVPGDQRIVAYVVLETGAVEDQDDLIAGWKQAIKNFMPAYMCPNDFVILDKLPMTPNGKVDRKSLPKPIRNTESKTKSAAQQTPNQKILSAIWTRILKVNNPDVDADFFELGGHSLIAIKMMSMLEKETGVQLPLSVLFECPTIALLAERLDKKEQVSEYKSLVCMKKGGNKMPLYIVHGARGTVPIFNRTIEHLHPDQPIYGLQARGLDGSLAIVDNVEEMASNYIAEIIKNNPEGPYALAGYSFGGIIAFEMARQLQKMNKEVKALIIFDTYADAANGRHSAFTAKIQQWRIGLMSSLYNLREFLTDPVGRVKYQREELKTKMHKPYRRVKGWIEGKEKDLFYFKYKIEETNLKAKAKYQLHEFDGLVELFRAQKRTYYQDDNVYLGWKPFAKKGVRIHEIPGEHNKIFLPPNVNELARKLQLCLDNSVREETIEIPVFYHKRMMEAV